MSNTLVHILTLETHIWLGCSISKEVKLLMESSPQDFLHGHNHIRPSKIVRSNGVV